MSTDGTKSALAWLTAGKSAVVSLGFAWTGVWGGTNFTVDQFTVGELFLQLLNFFYSW